ncbi:MAG: hypothetical protein D3908_02785 [Candidatus Electrothrix sp. AUS4]|nr:hypothetical protein [Candidatus Electrothrix sp. AUS4]
MNKLRNKKRLNKEYPQPLKAAVLALALSAAMTPAGSRAADITVDVGGTCTLAEAITSANDDDAAGNGCVTGSGADTITLEKDVTLSAALPEITSTVTIEGSGHTIDSTNVAGTTVLRVSSSGDLTLNETTVTGGNTDGMEYPEFLGGGIRNEGTLTLNNSIVTGNTAGYGGGIGNYHGQVTLTNSIVSGNTAGNDGGGIDNYYGQVTLTNSTVSGNTAGGYGGGIHNDGTATLDNSTISGNSAMYVGGGIDNWGTATLNNTTVSGNTAGDYGGGIFNYYSSTTTLTDSIVSGNTAGGYGGGICNYSSYSDYLGDQDTLANSTVSGVTLTNSTVSGNTADSGGGGIDNGFYGQVTLTNSTVSSNTAGDYGGGIDNWGTATLNNSIVSGNTAAFANEIYNYDSIDADSFNLFGHSGETNAMAFTGFTPTHGLGSDFVATSDGGGRPTALLSILSPLADNGGPTLTHALPECSPAINLDASCSTGLSTDQRGYSRPIYGSCDAGSVEMDYGSSYSCGKISLAPIYLLLLNK